MKDFPLKSVFIYGAIMIITANIACQAQAYTFPMPVAKVIPWNKPTPKTCKDYKLNGKVHLVASGQDSLYFDTLGRIIRERRIDWGKLMITTYVYDEKGQLIREEEDTHSNSEYNNLLKPDKKTINIWEYFNSGSLARKIHTTQLAEDYDEEVYYYTKYQYLQDSIIISEQLTDKYKGKTTGWSLQLDPKKRWIRKYDINPQKTLLETSYFDTAGHLLQIFSYNGQDSLLMFQRTDNSKGHAESEYLYNEAGNVRYEQRTIWYGNTKKASYYFLLDSSLVMQLVRTSFCNEKGEVVADSLHESGSIQRYYFKTGNPDFLQINTDKNGKEVWKIERRYNAQQILIYYLDKSPDRHWENKYDNNGNPIYQKSENGIRTTTYKYDKQGTWTESTVVLPSKKIKKESRTVLY